MLLLLVFAQLCRIAAWAQTSRWPEEKANSWYAQQKWLVGSNFVPKSAINQLEMWQGATFDLVEIDKEFAWAEKMGVTFPLVLRGSFGSLRFFSEGTSPARG